MRFAITSQDFRTVTGHAGKARRFIVYDVKGPDEVIEIERLDLPPEMTIHAHDDRLPHPIDGTEVLITGGAGDGFVARMSRRGVRVVRTAQTDPLLAIRGFLAGGLEPAAPHEHEHDHGHAGGGHCGCGCG